MRWHAYTSGTPLVLLPAQGRVEEEGEVGEAHVVALENLGAVLRVGEDGHCVCARVCARIHTQLFYRNIRSAMTPHPYSKLLIKER